MGSAQDYQKTEKKKIFKDLKNRLYGAFQKKKCDFKHEDPVTEDRSYNAFDPPKLVSVASMVADFDRLKLEQAKRQESIRSEVDNEELQNVFTYKIVKKEQNTSRSPSDSQAKRQESIKSELNDEELRNIFTYKIVRKEKNTSQSSNDSGFGEKCDEPGLGERSDDPGLGERSDEPKPESVAASSAEKEGSAPLKFSKDNKENEEKLVATLQGLELGENGGKRAKRIQKVYIARGKEGQKGFKVQPFAPYQTFSNRQSLSGGQVTVNQDENAYTDINAALSNVDRTVQYHAQTTRDEMLENLNLAQEFVHDEAKEQQEIREEFNAELSEIYRLINSEVAREVLATSYEPYSEEAANPIEEFHLNEVPSYCDYDTSLTETLLGIDPPNPNHRQDHEHYLTPPRSNENVFHPDSPAHTTNNRSIYSVNSPLSEYTLSPSDHSLTLSNEQYQEISVFPDLPESVIEQENNSEWPREIKKSNTLNLKQFKDRQNKLSSDFAKEECCKKEVGLARDEFKAMFSRLDEKVREGLCLRLAPMPLKTCYGVLQHVLMGLSSKSERDDMLCGIFCLICERVLVERPELFVEDFGLNLLKAAALRCWSRPSLTRYLVQSIRLALETRGLQEEDPLFTETDALGDTLLGALARRGDSCAPVLAEIVRARAGQRPLFPVHHCNTDGMSALHVACAGHGVTRALHTVHVLLEHAGADVWLGDIKGGDTAAHYAVKPGACDLDLVLTLFKHVDRKKWKQLAYAPNRSHVTPIDTARTATKAARYTYPEEVFSFLKKCRA